MAKANWLVVTPASGSGNGTVNVSSASEHTGRDARTTVLTFTAANCPDVARTIKQSGKAEYVDMADTAASEKTGKTVTIQGKSNSKLLSFSLGTGDLDITLPENYTANSVSTANGAAISGDPGASAEYDFSISVVVPANEGTTALTRQIIVTDNAGHQDTCTLTLAAGDAYLRVSISGQKATVSITGSPSDSDAGMMEGRYVEINGTRYASVTSFQVDAGTAVKVYAVGQSGGKINYNGSQVASGTYTFNVDGDTTIDFSTMMFTAYANITSSPAEIQLDYLGTPVSVSVESNVAWSVN